MSKKAMEKLSQTELDEFNLWGHDVCPDCRGEMLPGPTGGPSQNFLCGLCGSEFNLTIINNAVVYGERISDCGPREVPHERQQFYQRD